ncbi:MAG: hypothetical protein NUV57_02245 [archaeon]|nr:hypothetical protein [archaeon]
MKKTLLILLLLTAMISYGFAATGPVYEISNLLIKNAAGIEKLRVDGIVNSPGYTAQSIDLSNANDRTLTVSYAVKNIGDADGSGFTVSYTGFRAAYNYYLPEVGVLPNIVYEKRADSASTSPIPPANINMGATQIISFEIPVYENLPDYTSLGLNFYPTDVYITNSASTGTFTAASFYIKTPITPQSDKWEFIHPEIRFDPAVPSATDKFDIYIKATNLGPTPLTTVLIDTTSNISCATLDTANKTVYLPANGGNTEVKIGQDCERTDVLSYWSRVTLTSVHVPNFYSRTTATMQFEPASGPAFIFVTSLYPTKTYLQSDTPDTMKLCTNYTPSSGSNIKLGKINFKLTELTTNHVKYTEDISMGGLALVPGTNYDICSPLFSYSALAGEPPLLSNFKIEIKFYDDADSLISTGGTNTAIIKDYDTLTCNISQAIGPSPTTCQCSTTTVGLQTKYTCNTTSPQTKIIVVSFTNLEQGEYVFFDTFAVPGQTSLTYSVSSTSPLILQNLINPDNKTFEITMSSIAPVTTPKTFYVYAYGAGLTDPLVITANGQTVSLTPSNGSINGQTATFNLVPGTLYDFGLAWSTFSDILTRLVSGG